MVKQSVKIIWALVGLLPVSVVAGSGTGNAKSATSGSPGGQHKVIFRENFDADSLSDQWQLKNPDADSMTLDGGTLVLLSEPGDWQAESVKNLPLYAEGKQLPKNWRAETRFSTEVLSYPGGGHEGSWVGMVLYLDKDNLMEISVTGHCCGDRRSVQFSKLSKGQWLPGYEVQVGGADKQPLSYYLKVEKHGFSYTGAFSEDGKKWIPVGTHKFLARKFTPGLYAVRHSRALETTTSFDWFEISN